MTYEELQTARLKIQREANDKIESLNMRYAAEHNPVKVGDVVTDHYHTIRVEKMGVYGHPVPYCRYVGTELTKQGEPKKRQPDTPNPVYQNNIRTINGKPYQFDPTGKAIYKNNTTE